MIEVQSFGFTYPGAARPAVRDVSFTVQSREVVVAGRLAVTFTATFVVGAVTLGYMMGGTAPYAAAAMGLGPLAGAVALLVRAHRRVARLTTRRAALMRETDPARSVRP